MRRDKDRDLSRQMHDALLALPYQCWHNAKRALAQLGSDARYVEGWVVMPDGRPVEHGWCEVGEQIVDPTLPDVDLTYFAGLRFDAKQVKLLDREPYTPIVRQLYGCNGRGSSEYRAAFDSARHYAETHPHQHGGNQRWISSKR
jgi:hypothetical protein